MADKRKPETIIRELRREIRRLESRACKTEADRLRLHREIEPWHARARTAEQEVAEWKRRFDLLLSRTPAGEKAAGEKAEKG